MLHLIRYVGRTQANPEKLCVCVCACFILLVERPLSSRKEPFPGFVPMTLRIWKRDMTEENKEEKHYPVSLLLGIFNFQ